MTDNLRALPGNSISAKHLRAPNPEIVAKFEAFLEDAKSGKMQAFSITRLNSNGTASTDEFTNTNEDIQRMIGLMTHQISILCACMSADDE